MCLPYNFLKALLVPSTWIIMALSIVPIITIMVLNKNETLFVSFTLSMIVAGLEGLFIFLIGLTGFIGYLSKQRGCLCCYQFCIIVTLAVFIVEFVYTIVTYRKLTVVQSQPLQEVCNSTFTYFSLYATLNQQAEEQLCTNECVCYASSNESALWLDYNNFTYTNSAAQSSVVQFQMCPGPLDSNDVLSNVMQYYETTYQCAGWCNQSAIYLFSNINAGQPKFSNETSTCFNYFVAQEVHIMVRGQLIYFFLSALLTMITVLNLCYQFHPQNWKHGGSLYKFIKYKYTL